MNECAIRLEEQIISLFPRQETEVYQGWIIKKEEDHLCVHPLYSYYPDHNILQSIQRCETISRQNGLDCMFRIAEYTNYHLASVLTDYGYRLQQCCLIGELQIDPQEIPVYLNDGDGALSTETVPCLDSLLIRQTDGEAVERIVSPSDTVIGFRRQELLFIPDGDCLDGRMIKQLCCFSQIHGIRRIVVTIPGQEKLPEDYEKLGCHKAYLCRYYGKQEE
ncbi:MAG: hypothetical protein K2J67_06850 [Lachnospiraceae bacterium]|nr:hypothetical protein [Lachnospiraceae bacterium]